METTTEGQTVVVVSGSNSDESLTSLTENQAVQLGQVLESNRQLSETVSEMNRRLDSMEASRTEDSQRLSQVWSAIEQARQEAVAESVTAAAILDEAEAEAEAETETESVTPEPEPEEKPAEAEAEPQVKPPRLMRWILGE